MSELIAHPAHAGLFPVDRESILQRIDEVDPIRYGSTRNFGNGAVTVLSPYISRGVLSTKGVLDRLVERGFSLRELTPFIQQMSWREYFQRVWQNTGAHLTTDLRHPQLEVEHYGISAAVLEARTGIRSVDEMIRILRTTGYIHNHYRMYIASVACNAGRAHWLVPARWMYYHLLDADWASNACSWQWVAGAFSAKKYWVNQENINHYTCTSQRSTFLDCGYDDFPLRGVPYALRETQSPSLITVLPPSDAIELNPEIPTLVYTFHNLDPLWRPEMKANRILLLEPSFFRQFPVAPNTLDFVCRLAREIEGLKIFSGEWSELFGSNHSGEVWFKEHPTQSHFRGMQHERDWMFPQVTGYFPSFFSYWKKCQKVLSDWN